MLNDPPLEIERKWLLSALPPHLRDLTPSVLRQGYLPGDVLVERIRSVTRGTVTEWLRTVKLGEGMSRIEIEEAATPSLGTALFALTLGKRVEKRRYAVRDGELTWEIDDFTDRDLVLAEVELPSEATPVEIPAWLAPCVVREVTGERAFTNWQLAR
jgi:CYTH domain-containing protein